MHCELQSLARIFAAHELRCSYNQKWRACRRRVCDISPLDRWSFFKSSSFKVWSSSDSPTSLGLFVVSSFSHSSSFSSFSLISFVPFSLKVLCGKKYRIHMRNYWRADFLKMKFMNFTGYYKDNRSVRMKRSFVTSRPFVYHRLTASLLETSSCFCAFILAVLHFRIDYIDTIT